MILILFFSWKVCSKIYKATKLKSNIGNKWYHFTRRKITGNSSNSGIFFIKLGVGIATVSGARALKYAASCEARRLDGDGTRLVGVGCAEKDPEFNWSHFFNLLLPYWKEFFAALIVSFFKLLFFPFENVITITLIFQAALICAALNIHIPRVLGNLIDILSKVSVTSSEFFKELKKPAVKMLCYYTFHSIFTYIYIALLSHIGEAMAKTMRVQLFSSIMNQDIAFFDATRTGELINRMTIDIQEFKSSFKMLIAQGLRNVTQIIGCSVTLLYISPQMTGVMLVVVPSIILAGSVVASLLR